MAKLLVFGREGQVARALASVGGGYETVCAGRARLNLAADSADIAGLIAAEAPDAVINASAYTAVDLAETETAACRRLNRDAPLAMAEACRARNLPFVHVSTDYVFDGEKGAPYVEADPRRPLNHYGLTKAEGEAALEAVAADWPRLAIIRTAWVFAAGGGGFLGAMARLAREGRPASVVADQQSTPTPASACAEAATILATALLDGDAAACGLFHAAGADALSRADFADAIFERLGAPPARRVTTADYPAAARRPADTRLSSAAFAQSFGWRPPDFAAALDACLSEMTTAAA